MARLDDFLLEQEVKLSSSWTHKSKKGEEIVRKDLESALDKLYDVLGVRTGSMVFGDLVSFAVYHRHYSGLTKKELFIKNSFLCQRLRKNGLIKAVPVARRGFPKLSDDELIECYEEGHKGITRFALCKRAYGLYNELRKRDLLHVVPVIKKQRKQRKIVDLAAYYRENYDGVTRSELAKQDASFYNKLRKTGLLHIVPTLINDYEGNPLAYYEKYYGGFTRGKLQKANEGLYFKLKRIGLLDKVPTKPKPDYDKDPLSYYGKNYAGLTRGQLQDKNPGLYFRLRKEGLLKFVPKKRIPDEELIARYESEYDGLTRGKLAATNFTFYRMLSRRGLLHIVPTKKSRC